MKSDDTKYRILLADDILSFHTELEVRLEKDGYLVYTRYDGLDAVNASIRLNPDLILLNYRLPLLNGLSVCQEIRKRSAVPIIIFGIDADPDKAVLALDAGCDDCCEVSLSTEEITARIKCLLRRVYRSNIKPNLSSISFANIEIDTYSYVLKIDGKTRQSSPKEIMILAALVKNAGKVVKRDQLIQQIWHNDRVSYSVVNNHIKRIRDRWSYSALWDIETVRSVGYRLIQKTENERVGIQGN